jgi:integrase
VRFASDSLDCGIWGKGLLQENARSEVSGQRRSLASLQHYAAVQRGNQVACTLAEIASILEALEGLEPARTVVATAAFIGLRKAELGGLRWHDLVTSGVHVNRTVWKSIVQEAKAKTEAGNLRFLCCPCLLIC